MIYNIICINLHISLKFRNIKIKKIKLIKIKLKKN